MFLLLQRLQKSCEAGGDDGVSLVVGVQGVGAITGADGFHAGLDATARPQIERGQRVVGGDLFDGVNVGLQRAVGRLVAVAALVVLVAAVQGGHENDGGCGVFVNQVAAQQAEPAEAEEEPAEAEEQT